MSENGLNMIDLVLTHLNQPWGPPWTLATLGDMLENDQRMKVSGRSTLTSKSAKDCRRCRGATVSKDWEGIDD